MHIIPAKACQEFLTGSVGKEAKRFPILARIYKIWSPIAGQSQDIGKIALKKPDSGFLANINFSLYFPVDLPGKNATPESSVRPFGFDPKRGIAALGITDDDWKNIAIDTESAKT